MSNLSQYANRFFDELEVFEDQYRGHSYKAYLRQAVLEFLESESKDTAFAVYHSFFDSYRITLEGETNQFIDLLDVLLSYEERAATLIDKQRDHYVHSVNVFILGLCIYVQNNHFRSAFEAKNLDKADYPYSYDTQHEEFFYRWGIAALFHDVGYPLEIIGKQITKFIGFATEIDQGTRVDSHLAFENFQELNSIAEIVPKPEFIRSYYQKYLSCVYVDLLKPLDLLAHKLHISLGVDLKAVKGALDGFEGLMARSGFIDHGFYSAMIVLRWYGFLIQKCRYKPEYFFFPVLDSASAILLHNYYKNALMKPPFDKGALTPQEHPLAYLLILCDELQEWNRAAYGIVDKMRVQAETAAFSISDQRLEVTYLTKRGTLPEQFSAEKVALFSNLLDLEAVFGGGFSVNCQEMAPIRGMREHLKQNAAIAPRQLLENLEKMAIAIHELYNQKQLERHPERPLSYPHFSDLPDPLKYSNLRQARGIADKLGLLGWEIRPKGTEGDAIGIIPEDQVELLAIVEHEQWVQERMEDGWRYAEEKDDTKKTSPYLVPYDQLSEEIKDLDRDTIRNIPILLDMVGLAAYVKGPVKAPAASQDRISRNLPKTYRE